jgi:hypothetical protein
MSSSGVVERKRSQVRRSQRSASDSRKSRLCEVEIRIARSSASRSQVSTLYGRQLEPSKHSQARRYRCISGRRTQKVQDGGRAHRCGSLDIVRSGAELSTTTAESWPAELQYRRTRNSVGTSCRRRAGAVVQSESMEMWQMS